MSDEPKAVTPMLGIMFANTNPPGTRWQRAKALIKGEPPPGTIFPEVVVRHTFEFGDSSSLYRAGIHDWNVGAEFTVGAEFAHAAGRWKIVETRDLDPRKGAIVIVAERTASNSSARSG